MALNFPNSPSVGDIYEDSASGFSYQWDGTFWKSYKVDISDSLGGNLDADLTLNSNDISGTGNINITGIVTATSFSGDGSNLTGVSGAVAISTTAPTSPSAGDLWYNTDYGRTLIYYNDGDSSQWIDASPINTTISDASDLTVTNGINVTGVSTFSGDVNIGTGGTTAFFDVSAGRLGIGTISPAGPLEIKYGGNDSGLFITADDNVSWGYSPNIYFRTELTNGGGVGTSGRISSVYESSNNFGMSFYTTAAGSNTERARLDSSGNFGVGTASPNKNLHIRQSNAGGDVGIRIHNDTGTDAGTTASIRFTTSPTATYDTASIIADRATGSLAFSEGGVERMRIDSSGRLLVGTTSARTNFYTSGSNYAQILNEGTNFQTSTIATISNSNTYGSYLVLGRSRGTAVGSNTIVQQNDDLGIIDFLGSDGSRFVQAARIYAESDGTPGSSDMPGRLVFSTTADGASGVTERMRIQSTGQFQYFTDNNFNIRTSQTSSTFSVFYIRNNASSTTSGTTQFVVAATGNTYNTNGVYSTITSDERFKQDIIELGSQWDDIKGISLKKFRYKNDPTGELQLGVIAQELQQVCPGLVTTRIATEEDVDASHGLVAEGDEVLGWKMSILSLKAVKALQEAMERIETLESEVATLKNG